MFNIQGIKDRKISFSQVEKLKPNLLSFAKELLKKGLNKHSLLKVGTSGFRGRNNKILHTNIVAYSVALGELLESGKKVIVGYDRRSDSTRNALLCAVILEYYEIGTMITESYITISCLAKTVLEFNRECGDNIFFGVMCGASHNPLTDNGMNFIMPDGSIAEEEFTDQLAERALKADLKATLKKEERHCRIQIIDPVQCYIDSIIDFACFAGSKELIVVVDPLNGGGKDILPDLVRRLGVRCILVPRKGFEGMTDLDPRNNLEHIKNEVMKRKADLGILVDGDGDRVMFVYPRDIKDRILIEKGDFNEAFAGLLLYLIRTTKVDAVSTNVASSGIFRDICLKNGIDIYDRNPVGFKYQSNDMRRHLNQVIVGLEGNSGGFTISSFSHEKDGCLAAALGIKMIAETGSMSEIIDDLREKYGRRYIQEINVPTTVLITRDDRRAVINRLGTEFKQGIMFHERKIMEVISTDGIKIIFDDGSSLLFRASGTEPTFRVITESRSYSRTKELIADGIRKLKQNFPE